MGSLLHREVNGSPGPRGRPGGRSGRGRRARTGRRRAATSNPSRGRGDRRRVVGVHVQQDVLERPPQRADLPGGAARRAVSGAAEPAALRGRVRRPARRPHPAAGPSAARPGAPWSSGSRPAAAGRRPRPTGNPPGSNQLAVPLEVGPAVLAPCSGWSTNAAAFTAARRPRPRRRGKPGPDAIRQIRRRHGHVAAVGASGASATARAAARSRAARPAPPRPAASRGPRRASPAGRADSAARARPARPPRAAVGCPGSTTLSSAVAGSALGVAAEVRRRPRRRRGAPPRPCRERDQVAAASARGSGRKPSVFGQGATRCRPTSSSSLHVTAGLPRRPYPAARSAGSP